MPDTFKIFETPNSENKFKVQNAKRISNWWFELWCTNQTLAPPDSNMHKHVHVALVGEYNSNTHSRY